MNPKHNNSSTFYFLLSGLPVVLLLSTFYFLFSGVALASTVYIEGDRTNFAKNEEFLVNIFLNTESESINATEGSLVFPSDIIEVKEIRDGNSIVNFWVTRPKLESDGEIKFSGIIPGGYLGARGLLFSVVFKTREAGSGDIKTQDLIVLKNDGLGTRAKITATPLQFSVSTKLKTGESAVLPINDIEPPEDFIPTLGGDNNIFDGKYFLVFATQDKGSGVASYKVREGWFGSYNDAESPYLLKDQSLKKKTYVKAMDKSGNERVSTWESEEWWRRYQTYLMFAIIMLIILGVLFKKPWQRPVK